MARWRSTYNPLEHIRGGNGICPTITARICDENSQMVLYSPDIDIPEINLRYRYE